MTEKRFLHIAAAEHDLHLGRLDTFLEFLEDRLPADDFEEASSLLRAAIDPIHAASREREFSGDTL